MKRYSHYLIILFFSTDHSGLEIIFKYKLKQNNIHTNQKNHDWIDNNSCNLSLYDAHIQHYQNFNNINNNNFNINNYNDNNSDIDEELSRPF
jgi:hypothetical protein